MLRVLVIKDEDTDVGALLLRAGLTETQASSAIETLRALNPHVVDLKKISAGTVLLIPDSPRFKASATASVVDDGVRGFEQLLRDDLGAAARKLKAANASRAEEHAEVAAVQKTAAFKRIVETDPQLKQQLDEAEAMFKEGQKHAAEAEQTLEAATRGAMTELASLAKLLR